MKQEYFGECEKCGHFLDQDRECAFCPYFNNESTLLRGYKMKKKKFKEGDIVQINPKIEKFGGMILVVTDTYDGGVQGYLYSPYNFEAVRFDKLAYFRVDDEDFEYLGKIFWEITQKLDNEND